MFGVSFTEGLVLLIVGLIVLGPEKLPEAARAAARWYARIKQMITQVQGDFSREFDLQQTQDSIRSEFSKLKSLNSDMDLGALKNQILPSADLEAPNLPMQGYYFLLGSHARARRLPKPPRLPDLSLDQLLNEPKPQPVSETQSFEADTGKTASHAVDPTQ